jgi:hypothetical protein
MFLFSAIVLGAAMVARVEILVTERYGNATEALSAADAGLEVAIAELRTLADWTPVISGARPSALAQGAFEGTKTLPGGGTVLVCCGPESMSARLQTDTELSPLPSRRAFQWRPFLWTTMEALAPRDPPSRFFVAVWVCPLGSTLDTDDEDGIDTNGIVLRSEAVGLNGLRRMVEALIARQPRTTGSGLYSERSVDEEARLMRVAILRWREVR